MDLTDAVTVLYFYQAFPTSFGPTILFRRFSILFTFDTILCSYFHFLVHVCSVCVI